MKTQYYSGELETRLRSSFMPAGYQLTKNISLDNVAESAKYHGLTFSLNKKNIIYRKAKVTPDRPGAFLALWQRPLSPEKKSKLTTTSTKPIPIDAEQLDYLFVQVSNHELNHDSVQSGMFIFPVALLIEKGIVCLANKKGKTGFRVFPPWSQDRGIADTKVFSESGKKTQRWQLPYFVVIDNNGLMAADKLSRIFTA